MAARRARRLAPRAPPARFTERCAPWRPPRRRARVAGQPASSAASKADRNAANNPRAAPAAALAGPPDIGRRARDAPVARERGGARAATAAAARAAASPWTAPRPRPAPPRPAAGRRRRRSPRGARSEELDDVRRRARRANGGQSGLPSTSRAARGRRRRGAPRFSVGTLYSKAAVDGHARGGRARPARRTPNAAPPCWRRSSAPRARPREDDGREPRRAAVRGVVVVLVGVVVRGLGRVVEPVAPQDKLRGPGRRHVARVHLDARLAARQLQREARPFIFAVGRGTRPSTARREVHEGRARTREWTRRVLGLAQAPPPC